MTAVKVERDAFLRNDCLHWHIKMKERRSLLGSVFSFSSLQYLPTELQLLMIRSRFSVVDFAFDDEAPAEDISGCV